MARYIKVTPIPGSFKYAIDTDFEEIVNKARDILAAKRQIYTAGHDPLHNFNVAAQIINCSPERALQGMMVKHLVFLFDVIDSVDTQPQSEFFNMGEIDEKIVDIINYLVLLRKMLRQRKENTENTQENTQQ